MNRRSFLQPPQLGALLSPFAALSPSPDETPLASDYSLTRFSRRAMATRFEIALPLGTPDAHAAADAALDLIDELEDQMTVYREESEVSQLNRRAADEPVIVEKGLFELFERSAGWVNATEGAFDIATGALSKVWGFFEREGRMPTARDRAMAMARTGMKHVILSPETRSVKYRVPGLEINLGAVGKGYALDRAGELLRSKYSIRSALLSAGGE